MLRLAALLTLLPTFALADITGPARVIDGDTVEVHGRCILFAGVYATEA